MTFPAWDCVPYDRVSPDSDIEARRIATLARLAHAKGGKPAIIVLATVKAALQRVPPLDGLKKAAARLTAGRPVSMDQVIQWLDASGFYRTGTSWSRANMRCAAVFSTFSRQGTRAPSGSIFGDTLESIRQFDPVTQRTQAAREQFTLLPISEVPSGEAAIKHFRRRYVELFGPAKGDDALYAAVSAGQPLSRHGALAAAFL